MQAANVINCDYKIKNIKNALKYALNNKSFKKRIKSCKNPYGNGKSSKKIVKILKKIKIDRQLLDKRMTY